MDVQLLGEKEQMLSSNYNNHMINGKKHLLHIDSVLHKLLWKKKNPEIKFYNSQLYALPLREKEQNVIQLTEHIDINR